jgi:hypothetical protein
VKIVNRKNACLKTGDQSSLVYLVKLSYKDCHPMMGPNNPTE